MISLIVSLVNLFILLAGIYSAVKYFAPGDSIPVSRLTALVILLITISFLYYVMLIFKQDFTFLLILFTVVNLSHLYFTRKSLTAFFYNDVARTRTSRLNEFWALAAVLLLTVYFVLTGSKYGGWDAWAMWNLKAKFLCYPHIWQHLFSKELKYTSPDYPLMLPSLVAFFWKSFGSFTQFVPVLLAFGILLIITLLVYYALLDEGLQLFAYLALVILIIDSNFKLLATSQMADALLSMLILTVFIQFKKIKEPGDDRVYLLGFICASCAWVKNEGLVFSLLFTVIFLLINYSNLQLIKKYLLGFVIPALVVISYKVFFTPANDIVAANSSHVSSLPSLIFNADRYLTIFKFGINLVFDKYLFAIVLAFVVVVLNKRFYPSFPFVIILLQLCCFVGIYLITPYNLYWHLSTSLNRLFEQLYPSLIFLLLVSLKKV